MDAETFQPVAQLDTEKRSVRPTPRPDQRNAPDLDLLWEKRMACRLSTQGQGTNITVHLPVHKEGEDPLKSVVYLWMITPRFTVVRHSIPLEYWDISSSAPLQTAASVSVAKNRPQCYYGHQDAGRPDWNSLNACKRFIRIFHPSSLPDMTNLPMRRKKRCVWRNRYYSQTDRRRIAHCSASPRSGLRDASTILETAAVAADSGFHALDPEIQTTTPYGGRSIICRITFRKDQPW